MDFIGELVLAYVDQIIIEKLNLEKNDQDSDFHILRYRDDYRIFSNSQIRAEEILKIVSEALFEVGMRLNTAKTRFENNIVHGSLKVDKAAALERNIDYMGKLYKSNLHKILYKIHAFGLHYPNSGSLKKILVKLYQKIEKSRLNFENKESSAALLIDIAMISPNTYPVIIAILTYLLDKEDEEISHKLWDKIIKKTTQIPNNEYLQIWLQRGMIKRDTDKYMSDKEGKICKIVRGEKVNLWKNDWLNKNIIDKYLECSKIINKDELDSAPYPIPYNGISCFFDDDYDEPKILI